MSSHAQTKWYKAAEVAGMLRISSWTVVALCRSGKLRASKVAETWRISDAAVEEYMRACENEHASAPAVVRKRKRRTA
jgi:excisionase family DNA binding protein